MNPLLNKTVKEKERTFRENRISRLRDTYLNKRVYLREPTPAGVSLQHRRKFIEGLGKIFQIVHIFDDGLMLTNLFFAEDLDKVNDYSYNGFLKVMESDIELLR